MSCFLSPAFCTFVVVAVLVAHIFVSDPPMGRNPKKDVLLAEKRQGASGIFQLDMASNQFHTFHNPSKKDSFENRTVCFRTSSFTFHPPGLTDSAVLKQGFPSPFRCTHLRRISPNEEFWIIRSTRNGRPLK